MSEEVVDETDSLLFAKVVEVHKQLSTKNNSK